MFSLKSIVRNSIMGAAMLAVPGQAMAGTFVGDRTDFRDETIYFAMTTRFYDGDPTNNVLCWDGQADQIKNNDPCWRGDFKGLIDKLDYLKALGFTAIWMTPVVQNCSGFDYHGYHAMDFSKVDLRYESRKEWGAQEDVKFQDLVDAAHAKGMKIILDIVLNHTGNFGEEHFAKLFDRNQNIRNQATPAGSLIVDEEKLGAGYFDLPAGEQFNKRFKYIKNTGGQNWDTHNYWHHYGYGNWDDPSRWWFQIAGDCVDLNTENDAVADYLVKCYGEFIKMGVDGFRIDTTGHIARLTFNTVFIPQFQALGEKYKEKRLNQAPFFMFGECCSRFSDVTYRGQANLSCYYYTWDSPKSLKDRWNHDASWWDKQVILEGDGTLYGNMALCDEEPSDQPTSDNAFLKNGAWHEPDYSRASGFHPIDFPVHYNFNNVASALGNIKGGDKYYNDATWNVVYVDSHDYSPGPQDDIRFNGGTAQWAENLSFMFTSRGIPCLYYGSEVEFQKGKTIDKGPLMALAETGRAYYGTYLEGDVTATDFGQFTASGNVAKTLNGDLSQHIIRLNQIRAAVPALRKGQYSFDGCSANGGWAYKRAWKDESYALVAVNGGATFSNVPDGNYVDIVTGKSYTPQAGKITVDAPRNQGQLRVLVKDWKGGKVGADGKFIYDTNPVSHGGSVSFSDPGTTSYWRNEDVVGNPEVILSPAGGSFKTETLTVTAQLNEEAVSGWYQVEGGQKTSISKNTAETFTIGASMAYGQSVKVNWSATSASGEQFAGTATYRKVDPNASITVYVTGCDSPNLYAWGKDSSGKDVKPCGEWPGKTLTSTQTIAGREFYSFTFDDLDTVNIIFNKGGSQTSDITGITADVFYEYDGGSSAKLLDIEVEAEPSVSFSHKGGDFQDLLTVTATARNASSAWLKVGNGQQQPFTSTKTFTLGAGMAANESVTVTWSATNGDKTKTGSITWRKVDAPVSNETEYSVALRNTANWSSPKVWIWDKGNGDRNYTGGNWPGAAMERREVNGEYLWVYTFTTEDQVKDLMVIFSDNGNPQTKDLQFTNFGIYDNTGNLQGSMPSGVEGAVEDDDQPIYFNMQGVRVENPGPGIYLMKRAGRVVKTRVR